MLLFTTNHSKACDRSTANLFSVTYGAGYVDVKITTTIGAGITGTAKGGDASTRTFAYGVWGSPTLVNLSFTPSVTSDTTKATYNGINVPGAFGTSYTVAYSYNGIDFTCVSTTALCGHRHTDTLIVNIRSNELPDSIRVLGIEGAGNPFGGCYPDADMLVDLTSLPVVWAGFEARSEEFGVDLEWITASESNNDYFSVQRSIDGGATYQALGEVNGAGTSSKMNSYNFTDMSPNSGTNLYKIVQVDLDGRQSESEVRQVRFEAPAGMNWTQIGPNPVRDFMSVGYYVDENQSLTLSVVDLQGRTVINREVYANSGNNLISLDFSALANGFYSMQLQSSKGKIEQRVIKM